VQVINMLEIKKTAIVLEEIDLLELERIIIDSDRDEAFKFVKKSVYEKVVHSQQGKLKSHLDGNSNPTESFQSRT
jgi:hypothetical protein